MTQFITIHQFDICREIQEFVLMFTRNFGLKELSDHQLPDHQLSGHQLSDHQLSDHQLSDD